MTFGAVALNITDWTLNIKNRLAEVTNSASSGVAEWLKTVSEADGSCDFVLDSTNLPDTDAGATAGATLAIVLNIGDSGKSYSGSGRIESLVIKNPNVQGAVTGTLGFKISGALTLPVT